MPTGKETSLTASRVGFSELSGRQDTEQTFSVQGNGRSLGLLPLRQFSMLKQQQRGE
jgi:hypothetical protein